jgi:hypothetical protein
MMAQSLETGFAEGDACESATGGAAAQALESGPRAMGFAPRIYRSALLASCDRT